ncbi:MAG: hypothetical protein ACRC0L_12290, partial [Angustibacter sp.]
MSLGDPEDVTLPRLSWTGAGVDRAGVRRGENLLAELLADDATQVFEVWSGRLRVGPGLRLRPPEEGDRSRPAIFL